jgi:hypothetical protein
MRRRSHFFVSLALFCALPVLASDRKKYTDAENDDLSGPVKFVTTRSENINPHPVAPQHSWVSMGIIDCVICEYDDKGNRVLKGQDWGTGFSGEVSRSTLDENGNVIKITENEKGEIVRWDKFSPFGITEERVYWQGILQGRRTIRYNQSGQMVETSSFNSSGVRTGHSNFRRDGDGRIIEAWNFAQNNKFLSHYTDVEDPDTGVRTFTNFNENMAVRLTWTSNDDHIVSHWQIPGSEPEYGSAVYFDTAPRQRTWSWYGSDGRVERTITEFADDTKREPIHAAFHDVNDQVQLAVDYEYEFDGYHNWTKRSVWAWTPELVQRTLIKIDTRTIEYWQK